MSGPWVSPDVLDLTSLIEQTRHPSGGALVVFSGDVRDVHAGRAVAALRYEAHPTLAPRAIARIEAELRGVDGVLALRCVHRVGAVAIGDSAVLVVVRAMHRDAAFDVARRAIDRIKCEVPIYKYETYADGSSGWQPGVVLVNPDPDTDPDPESR